MDTAKLKTELSEKLEDKFYEEAEKKTTELINKALEKVFTAAGYPARAAAPMQRFYTEYGKVFLQLIRTEIKFGPRWSSLINLRNDVNRVVSELNQIVKILNMDVGRPFSLDALFIALAFPETARAITKKHLARQKNLVRGVNILDGLVEGCKELINSVFDRINETDKFLGNVRVRNNFDLVLGKGAVGTARMDLCSATESLFKATDALVDAKNAWAKELNLPQSKRVRLVGLEDTCGVIR